MDAGVINLALSRGEEIRRVRVLRTISAGNLLSQVGLARGLACRHATAQKPDKGRLLEEGKLAADILRLARVGMQKWRPRL